MQPPVPAILSPMFTRKTLAAHLGCSTATIDRDDQLGRLPRSIRIGQRKRWLRAEVEAWLEAGCPDRQTWESLRKGR